LKTDKTIVDSTCRNVSIIRKLISAPDKQAVVLTTDVCIYKAKRQAAYRLTQPIIVSCHRNTITYSTHYQQSTG